MTSTLLAEPISNPPHPAPEIEHKQLLYLLRCVDTVEAGTPDEIGIASMFIYRAWEMNYLEIDTDGPEAVFCLSNRGEAYMKIHGGPFAHREALRAS